MVSVHGMCLCRDWLQLLRGVGQGRHGVAWVLVLCAVLANMFCHWQWADCRVGSSPCSELSAGRAILSVSGWPVA